MPKILITGNGFDLNIGLPTSYNDFIKILEYIQNNDNLDFHNIFSNSDNYERIKENFQKCQFSKENIDKLKIELTENLWFKFFKKEYEIDSWIDFENRIEYVLIKLFTSLEYIQQNVFHKGGLRAKTLVYNSETFNNDFELIQVLGNFSIVSFDVNYMVTLNPIFLKKRYGFYSGIDLSKVTELLRKELIQFKSIFNHYFETFIFPMYDSLKFKIEENYYNEINYHYTFNYTPTFDRLFKSKNETRYLHGKINSLTNKIVLGINDIPSKEVNKKYFLPFTKYFQKLNNETDYIFIKEVERNDNYMFFFFGHSLDKSDEDYINEIFDYINEIKTEIKKIIVIYHNESSKSKLLINLLNIRGKTDIVNLMRERNLIFRHIDCDELRKEFEMDIRKKLFI